MLNKSIHIYISDRGDQHIYVQNCGLKMNFKAIHLKLHHSFETSERKEKQVKHKKKNVLKSLEKSEKIPQRIITI